MGDKHEESIEFEELNYDFQSIDRVRHSFRIPLDGSKQHLVSINQTSYPLIDIASHGVSFGIPPGFDLMEGERLALCRLLVGDQTIDHIKAEVIHLSPGSDTNWICGIHWLDLDENAAKEIDGLVQGLRKGLFPGKQSPRAELQIQPPLPTS